MATEKKVSMKRAELIEAVAQKVNADNRQIGEVMNAVFESIGDALVSGKYDTVTIVGFGTFGTRERAARTGHNPKTGEAIQIAAGTSVSFKAGKTLKSRVNGESTDKKSAKKK